jgi:hypothetical protein
VRAIQASFLALLVGAVLGACGSTGVPTTGPAAATTGPSQVATVDPAIAAAAGRLANALDGLKAGYTFTTTVTVRDTVATRATGRWTGGASEFDLIAAGVAVTYRSVPPTAWVRQADGTWTKLDGPAPGADPLAALRTPATLAILSDDAAGLKLSAGYPASALGLDGADNVTVQLTVAADGSLDVAYTATTGTGSGSVQTRMSPSPDQQPIVAPTG